MTKRFILTIAAICLLSISTHAQKTTRTVIYTNGVPAACRFGIIYIDYNTGNIYTFKTAVGCIPTTSLTVVYTAPTLLNSWANLAGGNETAGYTKLADGTIVIKGAVTTGLTGTVVFNLPVGYRPTLSRVFVIGSDGTTPTLLTISSAGDVKIFYGTSGTYGAMEVRFNP